jgi:Holliday junction resolvase RusA-like endonuclease
MIILSTDRREHRIWVPGFPKSQQSGGSSSRYRESIERSARQTFPTPLVSNQIEIEIVFADKRIPRPDVDNVPKPVLDALKGIVYKDDAQVVVATARLIPVREELRNFNDLPHKTFMRLFDNDEFLIRVSERVLTTIQQEVPSS